MTSPLRAYMRLRKSRASSCEKKVRLPPVNMSRTTRARSKHTQVALSNPSSGEAAEDVQNSAQTTHELPLNFLALISWY